MTRRNNTILAVFVSLLLPLVVNTPVMIALEVGTHERINERISFGNFDGFSLNTYLTNQLGINGGVNELFAGKAVSRWIRSGGRYEDQPPWTVPYIRSVNHYHNPTTEQGFSGFFHGLLSGNSLVDWVQMPIGAQSPGGHYSWNDVRDYFYRALTSTNNTDRERNFAETFRGLGQLMHVVHDASVPAHTRNDPHVLGYEKWVQKNTDINTISPIYFDHSILGRPASDLPIANIFDTNQYDGNHLEVAAGTNIGLTEYTNANFLSEDTINSRDFAYPRIDSNTGVVGRSYINPVGTYTRQYYLKNCCGETNQGNGYLLSAVDYFDYWRQNFPLLSFGLPKIPVLDDNIYSDYAKFLIPRAVGYSAGLLEYFFRGKLQVTSVPIFYKNSIQYLRAKIKNMTPNETMEDGEFTLTYSYRPTGGNPDGSQDIWGQAPVVSSGTLIYDGEETVIDFWLPRPIPGENYELAKFTLAFKGTLGNEEGAVIGKAHTLGEIKFQEEWDNGLNGNHNWAHTDFNLLGQNPDNGSTSNAFEGDSLIKDNIRFVGHRTARVNESFLSIYYNNGQFRDNLPIRITPETYVQFKIDEMWINQRTSAPQGYTNDWEFLMLRFSNGLGIQYSTQNQGVYVGPNVVYLEFDPNLITVDNIYKLFQDRQIAIPSGEMYLEEISLVQQMYVLEDNSDVEHHQHMKIDSIRIIEGKQQ